MKTAKYARIRFGLASCAVLWLASTAALAQETNVAETCALCHEQATQEWRASPHARTVGPSFLGVWEREGKKWECLVCHTSRYDRKTGAYSHEGVSCESCHGAANENHPADAKMTLPVTSEVCQACHSVTYGEWRISAHGQKNIRCFDCHKMHQMQLRKDDPDQMCGTCHTERLESFSHATHYAKGLHCTSCHMPEIAGVGMKIRGTGVRGHTFGVGAETCSRCHREMVHASHEHASLEQEVGKLRALTPQSLLQQIEDLQGEVSSLRASLQANRRVFPAIALLTFGLGLILGYALLHRRNKKISTRKDEVAP